MIFVLSNLFYDKKCYWGFMDNKRNIFVLNWKCFKKTTVIKQLLLLNVGNLNFFFYFELESKWVFIISHIENVKQIFSRGKIW